MGRRRQPGSPARRRGAAVLALAAVAVTSGAARAEPELPPGKFGLVAGLRQGVGALQDNFGVGYLYGVSAGYQPTHLDRTWSLGIEWSWLRGSLGADDPATIGGALNLVEMNLGGRARVLLSDRDALFAIMTGGVTLLRTNIPIPPDTERTHAGPYAGMGVELYIGGTYLVSLEARYGVIAGPGSLSVLASFAFGR